VKPELEPTNSGKQLPLPVYLIHWNAPQWVKSSVTSLLRSDMPVSITVVDNGPPSATEQLELPASVRLVPSGGNLGYAGGANVGLRDWLGGESEWCVIGAHDLHVAEDDLRKMLSAAESTQTFGILGPGTDTHAGKAYYAGQHLGWSEGVEERSSMSGTCLFLRRRCIQEVGLFDPQFGSYGEDDELCSRAQRLGWKVGRIPGTTAHGLGTQAANRRDLQMRNAVLLAIKVSGRWAGVRVLARHLKVLMLCALRPLGPRGSQHRDVVGQRWYGLRHGVPLLWARIEAPPKP
jgi:GT2 family glycosyltransferase